MENSVSPESEDDKKKTDLNLPFGKKNEDWVSWIYDHRAGVLATVAVYLILGIAFVGTKIVINKPDTKSAIYMDFEDVNIRELLEEKERLEREIEERRMAEQEYFDNLRNVVSDANADNESSNSRGSAPAPFSEEARAVEERMNANRQALEANLREVQEMLDWRNQNQPADSSRAETSRVRGDVTVEYSLEGRTHTYLPIPAYQCMGGGRIVINITVNRNGAVTGAYKARNGSNDPCLLNMALSAAERSRFNVSPASPDKQQGTITYVFKPQ